MTDPMIDRMQFDAVEEKTAPETHPGRAGAIVSRAIGYGPPIGGFYLALGIVVGMAVTGEFEPPTYGSEVDLLSVFYVFPLCIAFSYVLGGLQALISGFFLTAFTERANRIGYLATAGATLPASLAARLIFPTELALILGVISIAAALTVRYLCREIFTPAAA